MIFTPHFGIIGGSKRSCLGAVCYPLTVLREQESAVSIVQIPLTQGKVALVDASDAPRVMVFKWHAIKKVRPTGLVVWYAVRTIPLSDRKGKKSVYLHRAILDVPEGTEVDHVDGDGLNCCRDNLRPASRAQNACNIPKRRFSECSSRFVGVRKFRNKWHADIKANGKRVHIGTFADETEAAMARDRVAKALHGEFAYLNFPSEASEVVT